MPLTAPSFAARLALSLAVLWLAPASAPAQPPTPRSDSSAQQVLAQAEDQAASEHKKIFLTFGASWCGNCRLLDKFLADPAMHPIVTRAFVLADLDTGEFPTDTHHSNIAGGPQIEAMLGGKNAGYPFFVILDAAGKPVVNSIRSAGDKHDGNIGYPSAPWEIDWFVDMLRKSAPSITPQELAQVHAWLAAHTVSH